MVLALFMVWSCEKDAILYEDEVPSASLDFRRPTKLSQDSLLHIFARTLASAQSSRLFKQFLEAEIKAVEDEWGTILVSAYLDATIGAASFPQLLSTWSQVAGVPRSVAFFSDTLINAIPNLTISVHPGENNDDDISQWRYNSNLFVMPVTALFSDTAETQNIAYGASSSTASYSNWNDPDDPVMIVQADPYFVVFDTDTWDVLGGQGVVASMLVDCEDLLEQIQFLLDALANGSDWVIYPLGQIITIYNENCPLDDDPSGGTGTECDRDTRECREKMIRAKYTGTKNLLKRFCPWRFWGRDCLIACHVTKAELDEDNEGEDLTAKHLAFPRKYIFQKRRHMKKNKAWSPNEQFYQWEYLTGLHGDRYRMDFIGEHPTSGQETSTQVTAGSSVNFEVDDGTGTTTQEATLETTREITYTDTDQNLGGDIIYYCDDANAPGERYSTGLIEFDMIEANCN